MNGTVTVRTPDARVAIISTKNEVCIVEYPEDEKLQLWAGDAHYMLDRPRE